MEIFMALLMGVVYMASPGPVNIETLRRGVVGGFSAAFAVQSGAMVGHLAYAIIAFWSMTLLAGMGSVQVILSVLSIVLLLYLGWSAIRDRNLFKQAVDHSERAGCSIYKNFVMGSLISLLNPFSIAFWMAMGNRTAQLEIASAEFLIAFFVGVIGVALVMTLVAGRGIQRVQSSWAQGILVGCGFIMIGFGLKMGYAFYITL